MASRILAMLLVAATGGVATAGAAADALEKGAQAAAARGDYQEAATKYRAAYAETPRPDLICNVGVAYYKAKDLPRAQRYLAECAASGASLDATFVANVRTVLGAVEKTLAAGDYKPLNFLVQPATATTTFGGEHPVHDEPVVGSRRVWVPLGRYTVVVHADAYADQSLEIDATHRDPTDYSVKLVRATPTPPVDIPPAPTTTGTPTESAPPPPPTTTTVTTMPPPMTVAPPPRTYHVNQRRILLPALVSAAVPVLGAGALILYSKALGKADIANDATDRMVYDDAKDDARSLQHASWIVGGLAGVTAIAATYLWYRAFHGPAMVDVSPTAAGDGAAVGLSGRW